MSKYWDPSSGFFSKSNQQQSYWLFQVLVETFWKLRSKSTFQSYSSSTSNSCCCRPPSQVESEQTANKWSNHKAAAGWWSPPGLQWGHDVLVDVLFFHLLAPSLDCKVRKQSPTQSACDTHFLQTQKLEETILIFKEFGMQHLNFFFLFNWHIFVLNLAQQSYWKGLQSRTRWSFFIREEKNETNKLEVKIVVKSLLKWWNCNRCQFALHCQELPGSEQFSALCVVTLCSNILFTCRCSSSPSQRRVKEPSERTLSVIVVDVNFNFLSRSDFFLLWKKTIKKIFYLRLEFSQFIYFTVLYYSVLLF